ncbi:MAG: hypothetical protein KC416_07190 [Myxococcales bacterium]|nr:hypothetical protein [Myxococcales bacterium]
MRSREPKALEALHRLRSMEVDRAEGEVRAAAERVARRHQELEKAQIARDRNATERNRVHREEDGGTAQGWLRIRAYLDALAERLRKGDEALTGATHSLNDAERIHGQLQEALKSLRAEQRAAERRLAEEARRDTLAQEERDGEDWSDGRRD